MFCCFKINLLQSTDKKNQVYLIELMEIKRSHFKIDGAKQRYVVALFLNVNVR